MPHRGKIWTERDRYGDEVYLTWERWEDHMAEQERFVVTAYLDDLPKRG